jgi:hypothetical protein
MVHRALRILAELRHESELAWNAQEQPPAPVPWDWWSNRFKGDPELSSVRHSQMSGGISRGDVFAAAARAVSSDSPSDWRRFAFCVILWGLGRTGRRSHGVNTMSDQNLVQNLRDVSAGLHNGDLVAAGRTIDSTDGVGISFGTKFLYFLHASSWNESNWPLIFDDKVAMSLSYLTGTSHLYLAPARPSWNGYSAYLRDMHTWAFVLGIEADDLEFGLFSCGTEIRERAMKLYREADL